jgi:hypothetical protein
MAERPELHFEQSLEEPYEALEAALRAGPESWLPEFAREDGRLTATLAYVQGGTRIERRVEVEAGPVQRFAYGVTVHLRWRAARHAELYPDLEGHLRLEPRRPSGSSLRFNAVYKPPGGRVGATFDRALLHRVAESSVREFVAEVAQRLAAAASR